MNAGMTSWRTSSRKEFHHARVKRDGKSEKPASSQNGRGTLYPLHPPGSQVLVRVPPTECTFWDHAVVVGSSLFIVGSVAWVPLFYSWVYKRWSSIPARDKRRRALYAAMIVSFTAAVTFGPHRGKRFAKWVQIRKWKLWSSWLRFVAFEVIADAAASLSSPTSPPPPPPRDTRPATSFDAREDPAIVAVAPHGIFPFGIGVVVLTELAQKAFGVLRPVVASATQLFPVLRDILVWLDRVDATRGCVEEALANRDRIGIVPGGIAEMFQGYPKPNTSKDEEYSIVRRGFIRMSIKHGVPIVPVYCFGATKMLHRLDLPLLERLSVWLRIGLCIFYGRWGLPVPFRQRLMYVIGRSIFPPPQHPSNGDVSDEAVDDVYRQFCDELLRIFNRHKDSYGWSHKTLKLIPG